MMCSSLSIYHLIHSKALILITYFIPNYFLIHILLNSHSNSIFYVNSHWQSSIQQTRIIKLRWRPSKSLWWSFNVIRQSFLESRAFQSEPTILTSARKLITFRKRRSSRFQAIDATVKERKEKRKENAQNQIGQVKQKRKSKPQHKTDLK
jgi:hypothetical protein